MKYICPDYYPEFKCIADKCRHSCCIGWEIDVDANMLARYDQIGGEMGERLKRSIAREKDGAHFILGKDERCPFLNESELCDIITELGEDHLCQICDDHPRFRSFYSDREEIGLGLCCEEAARLILTLKGKMRLIEQENDGQSEAADAKEAAFFAARDMLFTIAQDRTQTIKTRLCKIANACGAALSAWTKSELAALFLPLERLDEAWGARLETLDDGSEIAFLEEEDMQIAYEQLLCYLLYRHLSGSLADDCFRERAVFAILGVHLVAAMSANIEEMRDVSRQFSAEIEYSDENIDALLDQIYERLN